MVSCAVLMTMLSAGMKIYARESTSPSMDMLEFIGVGVKVNDEIIDLMSLKRMEDVSKGDHENKAQDASTQNQQAQRQHSHD